MEFVAEVRFQDCTSCWHVPMDGLNDGSVSYSQVICMADGHVEIDFNSSGRAVGVQLIGFGIEGYNKPKTGIA